MALISCIEALNSNREMTVEEFKAWLRGFDDNNDGRISRRELKEALHSLRSWWGWWKAHQAMKAADSDRNGHIDSAMEMDKLVQFAQQRLHLKMYENYDDSW